MRTFTYLAFASLTGLGLLAACSGCTQQLAGMIVKAPNQGRTLASLEAGDGPPPIREPEQRFRVNVGPPDASLAVRVLDPAPSPMLGIKFRPNGPSTHTIHLVYLPEHAQPLLEHDTDIAPLDLEAAGDTEFNHAKSNPRAAYAAEPPDGATADMDAEFAQRAATLIEQQIDDDPATDQPKGTILILHGLAGDKERLAGLWGRIMAGQGYRTVLVDLRGHGESTGDWLTYGVQESRDLSQVLDELENRDLLAGPLGVLGISYGGATAIQLAADDPRVQAVAAIAPFATFQQAARDFPRGVVGPIGNVVPNALIDAVVRRSERLSGVNASDSNPEAAIARTQTPVLLIHGQDDKHLPPEHSRRLHAAAAGPSHLLIMPGETHMTLAAQPQPSLKLVRDQITQWFETWLGPE